MNGRAAGLAMADGATGSMRLGDLDLLRGVVAIYVVVFHLAVFGFAPRLLPHGYLGVDFFFILSGFVIAHAYAARLGGGLTVGSFAVRRLVRLYPLALIGTLAGAALAAVTGIGTGGAAGAAASVAFNGLVLPAAPTRGVLKPLFIVDVPMWSLFYELAVNFGWALVWPRLTARVAGGVTLALALALVVRGFEWNSINVGTGWQTFGDGFIRATAGIAIGATLYRRRRTRAAPAWLAVTLGLAVGAWLCLPGVPDARNLIVDLGAVFVVFPAVIWALSAPRAPGSVARGVGALSYPLYILHWPVLGALRESGLLAGLPWPAAAAAALGIAAAVGALAHVAIERPLCRALTARLRLAGSAAAS